MIVIMAHTHTLTSLLVAAGGPGTFDAFPVDIVPDAFDCALPNALPVEFNADAIVPLEL